MYKYIYHSSGPGYANTCTNIYTIVADLDMQIHVQIYIADLDVQIHVQIYI